jgi:hypothetical protein
MFYIRLRPSTAIGCGTKQPEPEPSTAMLSLTIMKQSEGSVLGNLLMASMGCPSSDAVDSGIYAACSQHP